MTDPHGLFNTRLNSKSVRAIDFRQGEAVDKEALKALIVAVVKINAAK